MEKIVISLIQTRKISMGLVQVAPVAFIAKVLKIHKQIIQKNALVAVLMDLTLMALAQVALVAVEPVLLVYAHMVGR